MHKHLSNSLNDVCKYLRNDEIEKAAAKFSETIENSHELLESNDFFSITFLNKLIELDAHLEGKKRSSFWRQVKPFSKQINEQLQMYIDTILKKDPNPNDRFRASDFEKILASHNLPKMIIPYLFAKMRFMQGVKEKNKQMLKEALDYLSVLALYTPQDQMQLLVDERAAVFHTYICFLSPAEAVEMIDQVLEDDWIKDSNVRSLLVVHRESSRFAKQLYDKSKKDLENVVKQYGSKNFEILTIFTGVIAFITYGLQIPGKATSLYDLLMLMFALLLSLVGLFSFIFSILRSGWYLILLFLVIGVFIGFIYMNPQGLKAEYVKQVASVTAKA